MVLRKQKSRQTIDDNDIYLQQLLVLFPNGDPDYFRSCLDYYEDNPVERIAEKFTLYYGSEYPRIVPRKNRLNTILKILALDLFPQCDVGFLRDLLLQHKKDRIELLVDQVFDCGSNLPERLEYGKLDPSEEIKSDSYKLQAETQLARDFPEIWKSSIRAVLAENNWDYVKSHDQLKEMGSGDLWHRLKNFVLYFSQTSSSFFNPQRNHEMNITDQLLMQHIDQLYQRSAQKQIEQDTTYAHQINLREYTDHQQLITCDCCYGDYAFEQLSYCSEGNHAFCYECLEKYMTEGLFGQGSLRGKPRIDCISSIEECGGCFSTILLKQILSEDLWKAYENSLLEDFSLEGKIRCCACSYFELDESIKPLKETILYKNTRLFQHVAQFLLMVLLMMIFAYYYQHYSDMFIHIILLFSSFMVLYQWDIQNDLEIAHARVAKSRRGGLFNCQNENCKTVTCIECFRPVRGQHTCWEKETDGLRLYVEKAMADAVKRTCPNCSLSFQKSEGCNKITCRCGYKMCYICRKDIGKESYGHFCNHFRETPGTKCKECTKCDLYKLEPENDLIEKAAMKARQHYLEAHPEMNNKKNIVIGPKSTLQQLGEWRHECVIWCLEKGLELIA